MAKRNNIFFFVLIGLICFSCGQSISEKQITLNKEIKLSYAKCFKIFECENYIHVIIINNKKTIANYILYKSEQAPELKIKDAVFIKTPLSNCAALSSIYIGFLNRLNDLDKIIAIDNCDYIYNPIISEKVNQRKIKEIAINGQINEELTIQLKPEAVFTYFDTGNNDTKNNKLNQLKIPIISLIDHFEQYPLGRAEWIKFFGYFFNKEKIADSLFLLTEKNYMELKQKAAKSNIKPKVLTEHKLNDAWYVPGGKSYMATLLQDANTEYNWKNDTHFGSLPLSFEEVYSKSADSDFWLNVLFCNSKTDLIKLDNRYNGILAFKKNQVYNNNLRVSKKGANDYWETGLTQPDLILSDIISIVHPEIKTTNQYYFYQKLK